MSETCTMKPRLTSKVLRGLSTLVGVVGAGECCDILGNDAHPGSDTAKAWDDILRACAWVRAMNDFREKSEPSHPTTR